MLKLFKPFPLPADAALGILGGGQLGRMLAEAANTLGLKTSIYAPEEDMPAAATATHVQRGDYTDTAALEAWAQTVDVITCEFENIPLIALETCHKHAHVAPSPEAFKIAQDRTLEKQFFQRHNLPLAPFAIIAEGADLDKALQQVGEHGVLKTATMGYDGKGQVKLSQANDLERAWERLGRVRCTYEAFVPFSNEVSIVACRTRDGQLRAYDLTQNVHKNHILHTSSVPCDVPHLTEQAFAIAKTVGDKLDYTGVFAIEFFVLNGQLLINEMAPRVHNSGHWTMDAGCASQFENHVRAIAGWPLGSTVRQNSVTMLNLIGDDVLSVKEWEQKPNCRVHLYGKSESRPGRKMGHVNAWR